jgi:hypothetical protein
VFRIELPQSLNSFNRRKCRTGNNDVNRFSEVAGGMRRWEELGGFGIVSRTRQRRFPIMSAADASG